MDPNSAFVAIVCTACVFLSPAAIVAIVLKHRERMASMKDKGGGGAAVLNELHTLRAEMAQLRETTTRYDMSFDAALQRVEERMDAVENRPVAGRYSAYGDVAHTDDAHTTLRRSV